MSIILIHEGKITHAVEAYEIAAVVRVRKFLAKMGFASPIVTVVLKNGTNIQTTMLFEEVYDLWGKGITYTPKEECDTPTPSNVRPAKLWRTTMNNQPV